MERQIIHLHAAAPAKPATGAPCNGCGVCCAAEPCPAGWLVTRTRGACRALEWASERYRCGLVANPGRWLSWLPTAWHPAATRFLARRIGAGQGCDSDAEEAEPDGR